MALGILGFNLDIERMQLLVIGLTIPWLLLARTPVCGYARMGGALLAGIASRAWIIERATNQPNAIMRLVETQRTNTAWLLLILAAFALWNHWYHRSAAQSTTRLSRGWVRCRVPADGHVPRLVVAASIGFCQLASARRAEILRDQIRARQ